MGLTEADGATIKPPAIAYGQVENWLVGASMTSCEPDDHGTWTCAIVRKGGYRGWIVWNPDQTVALTLPQDWNVRQLRDLMGNKRSLSEEQTISIGSLPLLFENNHSSTF
jgi:hypothetical protein